MFRDNNTETQLIVQDIYNVIDYTKVRMYKKNTGEGSIVFHSWATLLAGEAAAAAAAAAAASPAAEGVQCTWGNGLKRNLAQREASGSMIRET